MHLPGYPGATIIARESMPKNLGEIVEKALGYKLPNVVATDQPLLELGRSVISLGLASWLPADV